MTPKFGQRKADNDPYAGAQFRDHTMRMRITRDLFHRLQEHAQRNHMSASEYARAAIELTMIESQTPPRDASTYDLRKRDSRRRILRRRLGLPDHRQ